MFQSEDLKLKINKKFVKYLTYREPSDSAPEVRKKQTTRRLAINGTNSNTKA